MQAKHSGINTLRGTRLFRSFVKKKKKGRTKWGETFCRWAAAGLPSSVCFIVLHTIERASAPGDRYAATRDSSKAKKKQKTMASFHGVFRPICLLLCVTQLQKLALGSRARKLAEPSLAPESCCRRCVFWGPGRKFNSLGKNVVGSSSEAGTVLTK